MTILSQGLRYHKNCFRCLECNRLLDSLTNNDGADGGLYCKICYARKYGPQTRYSQTKINLSLSDVLHVPKLSIPVYK